MENYTNEYDEFNKLLENISMKDCNGKTVLCAYGEQEILKDDMDNYYLASTIYSDYEKIISKESAIEMEKEFKLKSMIDKTTKFFKD